VLGHFLARYANWARITAGVFAVVGLVAQCLTTLLGIIAAAQPPTMMYGMYYREGPSMFWVLVRGGLSIGWSAAISWVLLSSRSAAICNDRYRQLVAATSNLRAPTFRSFVFMVPTILISVTIGWFLILFAVGR